MTANEQREIVVLRIEACCQVTGEQACETIELSREYLKRHPLCPVSVEMFAKLATKKVLSEVLGE